MLTCDLIDFISIDALARETLNEENHSLKCPVCRAKHELSYHSRDRLYSSNERTMVDKTSYIVECKSCGERAVIVAWC